MSSTCRSRRRLDLLASVLAEYDQGVRVLYTVQLRAIRQTKRPSRLGGRDGFFVQRYGLMACVICPCTPARTRPRELTANAAGFALEMRHSPRRLVSCP